MQIIVEFDDQQEFGMALGELRNLLKKKARLANVSIRKRRPHAVLIQGEAWASALLLMSIHGYRCRTRAVRYATGPNVP
jgi:hypothetical protein